MGMTPQPEGPKSAVTPFASAVKPAPGDIGS